ncbi:MAG: hypothetical protein ACJ8DC_09555 [Gemmatimonadales bacterium]
MAAPRLMERVIRTPLGVLGALCLYACGHTDPASAPQGTDQPFDDTPPARLTFNAGPERAASWLSDGSGIIYSTQQSDRRDHDVCLAVLPPTGGSQRELVCDLSRTGGDTTNAFESPAEAPDGRLAFVQLSAPIGGSNPILDQIVVAPALDAANAQIVRTLPYTIAGETQHSGASALAWIDTDRLLYVGQAVNYRSGCSLCSLDTLATGVKVALLDVSQPGALPTAVPGTDLASGVSTGASPDEIFYTISGDSRVYQRVLSSGEVRMVHDFGSAGIARDVRVVGQRLVAVVGGHVATGVDSVLGPTQWDSGGAIHVVDLDAGTDRELAAFPLFHLFFRRPALSPSGDRIVVEGYPLVIRSPSDTAGAGTPDTSVATVGDLYLLSAP